MKWVRARDGAIFGVAKGLARTLDLRVGALRLFWLFSLLFFGAGLWIYLLLAVSLPREDQLPEAMKPWFLGVCSKIAKRTQVEIGLIRFLTICLSLMSFGFTLIGYFILYFTLNDNDQSSDSNPATPPPTT